jgi:hypothetical protein
MLLLFLLLQRQDPFGLAMDKALGPVLAALGLLATALAGQYWRCPRLAAAATAFLQMTLFTYLAVMLSYALAARGGALWDTRLAAWDVAIGFDWAAIRSTVDRSDALVWLLGLAYYCLIPQMIVAILALSCSALFDVLRVTVCAAIVSGFATVLISALAPADGNLFDPQRYHHLWAPVALLQAELIDGLRNGSVRVLDLSAMQGIITFPSYHAALAAIFIWAFRAVPGLAGFGAVWAGLTILATPLGGGHYAVDVLAGLLLAIGSLAAAHLMVSTGESRMTQQAEHLTRLAHRLRHTRDRISVPASETSGG